MIEPITPLDITLHQTIPLVYDDSMTFLELLGACVAKINEMAAAQNAYFDVDLVTNVTNILTAWQGDGTLNLIINEALQTQTDLIAADVATAQSDITAIEGAATTLAGRVTQAEQDITALEGTVATLNTKALSGKKIAVFGDSIAWGQVLANPPYISDVNWVNTFADITGADVDNFAEGGTTFANTAGNSFVNLVDTIDLSSYDFLILAYGTNDWGYNIAMGRDTYGTPNKVLFKDAVQYSLIRLKDRFPLLRVSVCIPLYCTTQITQNSQKLTRNDYADAINQMCARYNVPCIDFLGGLGINGLNAAEVFWDGTMHPTEATQVKMGEYVASVWPGVTGIINRQLTFAAVTLVNGAASGAATPGVAIDCEQVVHFRGGLANTATVADAISFTLPVHMRPPNSLTRGVLMGDGTNSWVIINTSGEVRFHAGNKSIDMEELRTYSAADASVVGSV